MKKSLLGLILCLSLCVNSYGATVLQENWEHADLGIHKFTTTNGTAAASTDQAHSGSYSLKNDVTTNEGTVQFYFEELANQTTIKFRFWVYIPQAVYDDLDNENDNGVTLAYFYETGYALNFDINLYYWDSFSFNCNYNNWGGSLSSATTPTADIWNCIEVSYYQHASAGYIYLYLNGVLLDSDVGVDTGANPAIIYYIGPDFSPNCKGTIYIDDIVWDNSNYVGQGYRIMQDGATGSPYHT